MDSTQQLNDSTPMPTDSPYASVDPFLIEVLQDFRHRLTVLRMELDVQKFLQNPEQLQLEFPHFPSSYMRLAAHRVAQHYGLLSMVVDNGVDALGKIVAMKTPDSKYPSVRLSDIPAKQPDNGKMEQKKIAIRRRPSRTSSGEDLGSKHSPAKTVEERKEQYDKARARIFNSPGSPNSDDMSPPQVLFDEDKNLSTSKDDGVYQSSVSVTDAFRDSSSRVAIFKDREKDLTDPDYDRSYDRYIKSFPLNLRPFVPYNMPSFQPPMVQYNPVYPIPRAQSSINYASHFGSMGMNQASGDAVYMQWPNPTMMYAQTYEPFRHAVFQAPFCQQPLSFEYAQNHH